MSEAVYRAAAASDIGAAAELVLGSVTDLAGRYGLARPAYSVATIEPVYQHIHQTGIFEVAELDGRIVAIAHAIVRDGSGSAPR